MTNLIPINTEREHIFSPDINVGITAKINKQIEERKMCDAVKLLAHRHPLLTATICFDRNNAAYYKLGSAKPIQPEFITSEDSLSWCKWMEDINRRPFDLQFGPLMKILVINSNTHTTIAALGHHLLGDGVSLVYFMRDFLTALDGNLDDAQLMPPIIQDRTYLPYEGRLRVLPKLMAKKLNKHYKKTGKIFAYEEYEALHNNYNLNRKPAMSLFPLNTEETQKLIHNCRLHHVTVNEAITTAFYAARIKSGNKCDYVGIACSVRDELSITPKDSMGNFVSGISISARYDSSLSFWDNARKIGDLLNKKLKNPKTRFLALSFADALEGSLIDAASFAGFGDFENKTAEKLCSLVCGVPADKGLGISNLGKFQMKFEQFSVQHMWFVPPLFAMEDFIAGVLTLNNEMRFCLRFSAADIDETAVEKLFTAVKNMLFTI